MIPLGERHTFVLVERDFAPVHRVADLALCRSIRDDVSEAAEFGVWRGIPVAHAPRPGQLGGTR